MFKKLKRALAITTAAILFVTVLPSCAVVTDAHGTSETVVTEDMLNNTPPEDYQINMDMQAEANEGKYSKFFLKDDLQTVKIQIDENNLNYILQNADKKPQAMTNSVKIAGETIGYAGLKTKGNYTLAHSFSDHPNSDRFSFSLNFGKYIKKKQYGAKQNFYGLSKVSFNNFFFDKTMLKEYCALRLMTEMGVPTPEYGLAKLYINGQYYGVYFMVESMDSSILERAEDLTSKQVSDYLVKPQFEDVSKQWNYDQILDKYLDESGNFDFSSVLTPEALENEIGTEGGMAEDEPLATYSGVWEDDLETLNDVKDMLPTVFSFMKKLSNLSNGKDFNGKDIDVNSDEYISLLEKIMDVDEVLRYYAVDSFLVQNDDVYDSYRNYGFYISEAGQSQIIPWDYDLSWGCFAPGNAEETANYDINKMYGTYNGEKNFDYFNSTSQSDLYKSYPLFNVIYQNNKLLEKFRKYVKDCSKVASLGGTIESVTYNEGKKTSLKKTYEPAANTKAVDALYEKIVKAVSGEKLASNVYYMNAGNGALEQPAALNSGIPSLKKIVSMRAVAASLQVDNSAVRVCTSGCDLSTLGNGSRGRTSTGGDLALVDESTGIYVIGNYCEEQRSGGPGNFGGGGQSPMLTVSELASDDPYYLQAKKLTGTASSFAMNMYYMTNTKAATGEYTISLPMESKYAGKDVSVYLCTIGSNNEVSKVEKLSVSINDNIYTAKSSSLGYIAVAVTNKTTTEQKAATNTAKDSSATTSVSPLKTGKSFKSGNYKFKVNSSKNKTVTLTGIKSASKKKTIKNVTIGATVTYKKVKYKVTKIANSAFANCKKLKKVVIGKNIVEIGKKAFYKDSKLKTIIVKSKKLKKIGKNAFKGIHKKAKISFPKSKFKKYKKLFKGKGQKSSVKYKKA